MRFWATITRDWAIAVAVAVAGLAFTDWYEPYGWLAVIVFVPWFLLFVLQVGRRHDLSRGMTVAGMVIGAALVMTYYYPFFIGALALVGLLAARRVAAAHGIALGPKFPRRTVIVLIGHGRDQRGLLAAAPRVGRSPRRGAKGYQNRYLDPATVDVPLPFLTFDLVGFVLLFGLGYLVLSARRSPASMGLLALLAGAYAWIALGYVGILVDVPLLTGKTVPVIEYTLVVGAAAGAVMIGRQIAANATVRRRVGTTGLVLALGGGAVVVALALGQDADHRDPVREGATGGGARPPSCSRSSRAATHGRYDDTVVLTDVEQLPELLPGVRVQRVERALRKPGVAVRRPGPLPRAAEQRGRPGGVRGRARAQPLRHRGVDRVPHHQRRHASPTRSSTTPSRAA